MARPKPILNLCARPGCNSKVRANRSQFCSRRCSMLSRPQPTFEQRLTNALPKPLGPSDCWMWTHATDRDGYGVIQGERLGQQKRVPRCVYERHHGQIPPGRQVMHTCDVPQCVNPAHLRLGDHQANVDDKVAKGRQARGEAIGQNKLTAATVLQAREAIEAGETDRTIALRLSVSPAAIWMIRTGRTWNHVR